MAGEVRYLIQRNDAISANRQWYLAAVRSRKGLIRLLGLSILVAVAAGWILGRDEDAAVTIFIGAGTFIYCAAMYAFIVGVNFLLLPRRAGRLYDQTLSLKEEMFATWNDENIAFDSLSGRSLHHWSALRAWRRGGDAFLFFVNDNLYHIIPVRALSPAASADLERTAKEKVGPPGVKIARSRNQA